MRVQPAQSDPCSTSLMRGKEKIKFLISLHLQNCNHIHEPYSIFLIPQHSSVVSNSRKAFTKLLPLSVTVALTSCCTCILHVFHRLLQQGHRRYAIPSLVHRPVLQISSPSFPPQSSGMSYQRNYCCVQSINLLLCTHLSLSEQFFHDSKFLLNTLN